MLLVCVSPFRVSSCTTVSHRCARFQVPTRECKHTTKVGAHLSLLLRVCPSIQLAEVPEGNVPDELPMFGDKAVGPLYL